MESFQFIEYQRQRDFSKKVNATFEFIKQNFKSLFKSILFIAGPPVLIGSMLMGSFFGDLFSASFSSGMGNTDAFTDMFTASFFVRILLTFVFVVISGVITLATINNYLLIYQEKRSNQIEVNEVWKRVRATFWMYLGTMVIFALLGIAVYIVMLIPIVALGTISPGLVFLGALFMIIGVFYLLISVSLTFFVRSYEKLGFFDSLVRSYNLVQGKWWSTFGLLFILYMIMGIISYIPIIPFYIVVVVNSIHSVETGTFAEPSASWEIWTTLFFTLYYLLQMFLNTLPNIGLAFQYFNLVELKEAKGLMSEIETLGKPVEGDRPEENF